MSKDSILGVMSITNNLALYINEIEYGVDDRVVYRFSDEEKVRKAKVYTTTKGRSYFKIKSTRYYLDEFMNVGGM